MASHDSRCRPTRLVAVIIVIVLAAVLVPTLVMKLKSDKNLKGIDELIVSHEGETQITREGNPVLKGKLGTLFHLHATDCEPDEDQDRCLEWTGLARLQVSFHRSSTLF